MGAITKRRRHLLVPLAGALLSLLVATPAAWAAFPGQNGKIFFSSNRDEAPTSAEIYAINPDGTGIVRLTNQPGPDVGPEVSPDGRKVAFASARDDPDPTGCGPGSDPCDYEIYVMNADGTNQTRLTTSAGWDFPTSWSPDGTKLLFETNRDGGNYELYAMNADGTGQVNLTNDVTTWDMAGSWSPDGTKIVFRKSNRTTFDSDIYVMNADGTGPSNITENPDNDELSPDWSPSGHKIAFVRIFCIPDCSQYVIHSMNPDGSGQTNLDSGEGPSWSPDGRKIVYSWTGGIRCTAGGMNVMNADGSGNTPLTSNSCESLTFDTAGDWQPLPGFARPQGAARLRVPLALAYEQCGDDESPDRTHGPSLVNPSCNPHVQASDWLTLGTADANGFPAQGRGSIGFTVCPNGTTANGSCATPAGMSAPDVKIAVSIGDVRCRVGGPAQSGCLSGPLSDYVGELEGNAEIRITDRNSGTTPGGGSDPATAIDLPFPFAIDCVANPAGASATSVGGTCALDTHAEAVALGMVQPEKRMNVELGRIEVHDGGPDGLSPTADNTPFMTQGVFVP